MAGMLRWLIHSLVCLGVVASSRGEWVLGERRELGRLAAGAVAWELDARDGATRAIITGVSFSSANATLRVLDNPPDARTGFLDLLRGAGAIAGVNASYFHEDYRPLGLVVSEGKTIHAFETAKLLSGVLAVRGHGSMELVRSSALGKPDGLREAVQAGPWLVENGVAGPTLNAEKLARRTVVATNGKGEWALVIFSPLTLAQTGALLTVPHLAGDWKIQRALNLDGGSSTSLIALENGSPVVQIASFGPVRNYLAIVPRAR